MSESALWSAAPRLAHHLRIDPTGKLLETYKRLGFTMHNDSGHKPYTDYYDDKLKKYVQEIWMVQLQ